MHKTNNTIKIQSHHSAKTSKYNNQPNALTTHRNGWINEKDKQQYHF